MCAAGREPEAGEPEEGAGELAAQMRERPPGRAPDTRVDPHETQAEGAHRRRRQHGAEHGSRHAEPELDETQPGAEPDRNSREDESGERGEPELALENAERN